MTKIEEILDRLVGREGNYSNNAKDAGGPTRWGITEAKAREHGYHGDMQDLPQDFARAIYRGEYWTDSRFADVAAQSPAIAEELLDTGVNCGVPTASIFLQRCLNAFNQEQKLYPDVMVDGRLGDKTLVALKAYLAKRGQQGEAVMLKALNSLQGAHYIELCEKKPSQEEFEYGWFVNRVDMAA